MVLEKAFDEAAWRQPAVIVLDDLDVVAPSSNNPAAEMSGEAVYAAKVTEGMGVDVSFSVIQLCVVIWYSCLYR